MLDRIKEFAVAGISKAKEVYDETERKDLAAIVMLSVVGISACVAIFSFKKIGKATVEKTLENERLRGKVQVYESLLNGAEISKNKEKDKESDSDVK